MSDEREGDTPSPTPSRGGGWLRKLRPLFALAILALVAATLPWSDQLEWTDADEETHTFAGALAGDWTAGRVTFRFEAADDVPAAWPEALRSAAREGAAALVERSPVTSEPPGPEGRFAWKPSMQRVFRELERGPLARAMALFVLGVIVCSLRWWRLLALAGCTTRFLDALRLTFLGYFFNLIVPGLTGGDLPKAVLAAKENPGKRADAVVSVVVDRVLGLLALITLACVVILASGDAFAELRLPVGGLLALAVFGGLAYGSRRLRRALRIDVLAARLPLGDKLRQLDRAALAYARRPLDLTFALVLSFVNHVVVILAVREIGLAFGMDAFGVVLRDYFVVVPVGNVVTALPLSPGGWGIGEAIYKLLFEMVGGDGDLGVAVSITFRLCQLALGLLGGLFLLAPGGRADLREAREEAARDRSAARS